MKKFTFFLGAFLLCSNLLFSQWSGNGTSSSPYTGTLQATITWYPDTYPGQTIYAQNITIPTGVTLTISPGIYYGGLVQFTSGRTLTIDNGGAVVINPQTAVTVYRIINNGSLRLESDANEAGVASLIHDLYSGTGISEVELYLSGGTTPSGSYRWHYISTPVNSVTSSIFNTPNLAQYIESLVIGSDNYLGWVAYDGYQYGTNSMLGYTFDVLNIGQGYNYYSGSAATISFSGAFYIASFTDINLTCGSGFPDYQGFNLLGNPFASCLDWDELVSTGDVLGTVNNAIYFTNNGTISSYVGGLGESGGTGTIPPLQGFFVKANSPTTITLPAAARTHAIDQMRYKKKSTEESYENSDTISFVRLNLKNLADSTDLVVRFNKKATTAVDKEYDAYEFSRTAGDLNIWTSTASVDYSINGLPFPENVVEIPVGVNVKAAGTYRLSSNELKKLENYSVTLKDLSTNKSVDLKQDGSIEFNAPAGMIEGRFILAVTNTTTAVPEVRSQVKKFNIYSSSGVININSLTDELANTLGSISVYDMAGRKVYQQNDVEWNGQGDVKQVKLNSSVQGLYIIEIKAGSMKFTEKVSLNH